MIPSKACSTLLVCALLTSLGACNTIPQAPPKPVQTPPPVTVTTPPLPDLPAKSATLQAASWAQVPGWAQDNPAQAWDAFVRSCGVLKQQVAWKDICQLALTLPSRQPEIIRAFFESHFTPYRTVNADGSDEGLITGYYEPLLRGSRVQSPRYRFPVYGVPDDLLTIELGELYPELKNRRLRGRIQGRKVVPYYNRADIENGLAAVRGKEIVWVEDAVELFFLQIQGSGRVKLDSGDMLRIGYADQNGHPYRSIGKLLVEQGEMPLEKASMQGIKAWAKQNPEKLAGILDYNASYVFFRELPESLGGPIGSLGVPLSAGRSIAIDPRHIPQGAPVFLSTTWPNTTEPLNRLMMAQDTGGAINGQVRADFFWGFGEEAAIQAGKMKQRGKLWVLYPKGYSPPETSSSQPRGSGLP